MNSENFVLIEATMFNLEMEIIKTLLLANTMAVVWKNEIDYRRKESLIKEVEVSSSILAASLEQAVAENYIDEKSAFYLLFFLSTYIDEKMLLTILSDTSSDFVWNSLIEKSFGVSVYSGEKIYELLSECAKIKFLPQSVYRTGIVILNSDYCGKYSDSEINPIKSRICKELQWMLKNTNIDLEYVQQLAQPTTVFSRKHKFIYRLTVVLSIILFIFALTYHIHEYINL
jgi:type VI protein secretion system component VasF